MPEKIRLRIGNMGKAVLVSGQAYQDPKDALNEFVSNAADEYAESGARGERIRIVLRRRGRYPVIAVEDAGRGMGADRLREVARNLFNSSKAADPRTLGEKAIGMLAFQQLGERCDIVTRSAGSTETLALRLERGSARAELELNDVALETRPAPRCTSPPRPRRPAGADAPKDGRLPPSPSWTCVGARRLSDRGHRGAALRARHA